MKHQATCVDCGRECECSKNGWRRASSAPTRSSATVKSALSMPLCRAMGTGLWEIRTDLPTKRTARVSLCVYREHLVALHGFIKKTRTTPDEDLALARKRKKELEQ